MRSNDSTIEDRLRLSRSAGVITPPERLSLDAASLPERAAREERLGTRALAGMCAAGLVAVIAIALVVQSSRTPGPSASEAVSLSFEAIPQTGADVTRRILEPVRREMNLIALHSRRAKQAVQDGLQFR